MTTTVEQERNTALLAWYGTSGRDLPWRTTTDPYRILAAEVMLQQTQAARVVEHYLGFLARFPTARALAEASLTEVLDTWSGLGYNSRAVRLREAARHITDEGWPADRASLEKLPGVGPYTAAAIASFCFGEHVAATDTNLRRVLSRWYGEPLMGRSLELAAQSSLGADAVIWNQAMMDLGAMVCSPRNPDCVACPVEQWCSGPETYVPPRPQTRFEGSTRQVRGALVRSLVTGSHTTSELAAATGFRPVAVTQALDGLIGDGLVAKTSGGRFSLSA